MTDELKPPVAVRITRPFATEAEFLEREFDTLTRTSVVLLGAQPRPQGVVLRFEIVLLGGESILRGEGRVVAFKERAHAGEPGLTLRFTRLDSRSKALVDKASALRDARVKASTSLMSMPAVVVPKPAPIATASEPAREQASPEPPKVSSSAPPPPSRRTPPPLPEWARAASGAAPPEPLSSSILEDIEATQVDARGEPLVPHAATGPAGAKPLRPASVRPPPMPPPLPARAMRISTPPPFPRPIAPTPARSPAPPPVRAQAQGSKAVDRPADRDVLLSRLRIRAEQLPAARVAEILTKRARG